MTAKPDFIISIISVVCCGRTLRNYMRVPGDPPQWHLIPTWNEGARGIEPEPEMDRIPGSTHGDTIELRCRTCRFRAKHRLDRAYGRDLPPFTEVFERLRDNGISEVAARDLDTLADWPTRLR